MIRKAAMEDLCAVERLYNELHDAKEAGIIPVIWKRGVYPSRETAIGAISRGDLFVLEAGGRVVASAVINGIQDEAYAGAPWEHDVPEGQVCVLHTLMVSPSEFGKGYAREFLDFYEEYALEHGCPELRIDTNDKNTVAQAMYRGHGYEEIAVLPAGIFNGIEGVRLMLLEKYLG